MTHPEGHGNAAQRMRVEALETQLRQHTISNDELLELALLSLEPGHDAFRAAELLEDALARNPEEPAVKIWLAHCWIYEFMDEEHLWRAVKLCDEVTRNTEASDFCAAAFMLKGAALIRLSEPETAQAALEMSTRLAPSWVTNRQLLASSYADCRNYTQAEEQLRAALVNAGHSIHSEPTQTYLFELFITGRAASGVAQRIREQLAQLKRNR